MRLSLLPLLTLLLPLTTASTSPSFHYTHVLKYPAPTPPQTPLLLPPTPLKNSTPYIILPLGNSITWGYGSTHGAGYRLPLQRTLYPSNAVTFIGSVRSGNMSNPENEGHPGAIIDEITTYASLSLYENPNLILVMAGTNDMAANISADTAPERLGRLIDTCVNACPEAVVLVAQITRMLGGGLERVRVFNDAIPGLVEERVKRGKKVLVVDMENKVGWNLGDGLHPNDEGYERMAEAWVEGIKEAEARRWIRPGGN